MLDINANKVAKKRAKFPLDQSIFVMTNKETGEQIWHASKEPRLETSLVCQLREQPELFNLVDINTGKCLYNLKCSTQNILCVLLIAHKHEFLTTTGNSGLKRWDLHSSQCLQTYDALDSPIERMLHIPDLGKCQTN